MHRGDASSGTDAFDALSTDVRMALTRMENQRKHAENNDVVKVFTVPTRVFFGLIRAEQQIRSTDVASHLARGVPVTVQSSVMEWAQDLVSKRYLMLPRLLPGKLRLDSVAELTEWVRQGARVPKAR